MTEKQLQLEAQNKLHREGWIWFFPPRTWGERDVFGVFDFIAVKGRKIIYVQLTTRHHIFDRRKKIQNFFGMHNVEFPNAFIWGYDEKMKGGSFKVERVKKSGEVEAPILPRAVPSPQK